MIETPETLKAGLADSKFTFLVLGCGRSGTSLLASMLDTHTTVEVGFELFAHQYLLGKALPEHPGSIFQDRTTAFLRACIEEANRSKKPIWGNKITTEQLAGLNKHNLFNTPAIDTVQSFFETCAAGLKTIYILRDGRACIKSKLTRTTQSLERACDSWKFAVRVYEYLLDRPGTCCVRFEDLLSTTTSVLEQVFGFLGIEPENEALQGAMNPKMPGQYRRSSVDASRATDVDHDHSCTRFIADELARCGYT